MRNKNSCVPWAMLWLCLIPVITATTCLAQVQPARRRQTIRYSGRLLSRTTGKPIAAARITLSPSNDDRVWKTDSQGRFAFWAEVQSDQRLSIDAKGYESLSLIVQGGSLQDIRMLPVRFELAGSDGTDKLLPPSQGIAPAILIADTGPELSGAGKTWSHWYHLGTGKAPGGYTLQRVEFWLSGDRSCGSGAQCRELVENDDQVLWEFRLRGHEEMGIAPQATSVAHIRVFYRPE